MWIILELCTGGTLLDAALAGTFKPTDVIVDRQPRTSGHPQLEMVGAPLDAAQVVVKALIRVLLLATASWRKCL